MSLIVTVHVPEGIALSADSRATGSLVRNRAEAGTDLPQESRFVLSDAVQKLFVLRNKWGLGLYGNLAQEALHSAKLVRQFEQHQVIPGLSTAALAERLQSHAVFGQLKLLLVGYDHGQPQLLALEPGQSPQRLNLNPDTEALNYGVVSAGDTSISDRLLSNPEANPRFGLIPLQTAVDLSRHLIRATIGHIAYEPRFPTVGGPIDTLVIRPEGAQWLYQKSLTVNADSPWEP